MGALLAFEVLGGLAALAVVALLSIAARRRWLQRGGGTVDVSLRLSERSRGRGWALGVGVFAGDELRWYRVFSLSPRPRRVLSRRTLEVVARREPTGPEAYALLKGAQVLACREPSGPVEVALEPRAVTGFLAWLEARPPGSPAHH